MNSLSSSPSSLHQHMSAIRTACSERSAGGERGGDGEESIVIRMGRIVIRMVVFVFVFVIIIVDGPRKSFKSDESGKRQIGVSGVEGERVWKRAGGSAAAGCCWGHFFFFFGSFSSLGWIFGRGWRVLKFFFIFIWMVLVDAGNIDVVVVVDVCFVLPTFSFRLLNLGHVEDPKPEAEVKWNTVGWK